ncbi:PREDICTED: probable cytokinin riboside 5'-monophosphate phosphoribohydrolase LOG4 [Acropora digitifera]|uniref:probable cytokinin riboside 5'-monophosphate phosphoribohydrolase LOG4 n=1 Tax=Acropora digitifera TaxID=70779 RepID=UPI00077B0EBF|nr:PREDICTED: probable cytokinin riboside 5'-monophosphate phosphoribohydrolase LOG4 [Acropora digitifera]
MALKTVTVFCGSSLGNDPRFQESAKALGECLAKRKINLIYGGGTSGLMGTIAKTMSDAGCVVTGFLPEFFVKRGDCELDSFGKTVMVTDMHTRKQQMFEQVTFAFVWPHIKI